MSFFKFLGYYMYLQFRALAWLMRIPVDSKGLTLGRLLFISGLFGILLHFVIGLRNNVASSYNSSLNNNNNTNSKKGK